MIDRKSLVEWGRFVIVAVPLVVTATTLVISAENFSTELAAIHAEQINIRKELALQTADLEEIRKTQGAIRGTQDRRFDKIEDGHDRIIGVIADSAHRTAVVLGRVSERTRKEGEKNHGRPTTHD